ncbi:MAG: hypothetical protein NTV12_05775 [Verrucomicrobia bacterium]|nr:hypothetical protein [Verrucomicrobiota bacterium]
MKPLNLWLAATVLWCVSLSAQDRGHLNVGAVGQNAGDALIFPNGPDFNPSTGWSKALTFTNWGTYAGFWQGNITLTALATTVANGGPAANAAAPGSFLRAEIVSVTGPVGSSFGFWEKGSLTPTYSIPSGTLDGHFTYDLSDAVLGAGAVGADPFGHIHDRRFTVDMEGEYTVGFRAFDTSVNGLSGQAIHTPSEILLIGFTGTLVPEPSTFGLAFVGATLMSLVWRAKRRSVKKA